MEKLLSCLVLYVFIGSFLLWLEETGRIACDVFLEIFLECSGILWTLITIYLCFFTNQPILHKILCPFAGLIVFFVAPVAYFRLGKNLPKRLAGYRNAFFKEI